MLDKRWFEKGLIRTILGNTTFPLKSLLPSVLQLNWNIDKKLGQWISLDVYLALNWAALHTDISISLIIYMLRYFIQVIILFYYYIVWIETDIKVRFIYILRVSKNYIGTGSQSAIFRPSSLFNKFRKSFNFLKRKETGNRISFP